MKTSHNRIINQVLLIQIIFWTLSISGAIAMEPDESDVRRSMSMRNNETTTQFNERVKNEHSHQVHQARMLTINTELIENNERIASKFHGILDNNRWIWYIGFAGAGSGLWLSTAFGGPSVESSWFVLGGVAASVVVGGISKCLIKNCCDFDVDTCMKNTCINIAGGLSSFIPWAGFAITISTKGHPPQNGTLTPTSSPTF